MIVYLLTGCFVSTIIMWVLTRHIKPSWLETDFEFDQTPFIVLVFVIIALTWPWVLFITATIGLCILVENLLIVEEHEED